MRGVILIGAGRQLARVVLVQIGKEFSGNVVELTKDEALITLFSSFEDAVNDILLVEVDRIQLEIAALNPTFQPDSGENFLITDLQLYPNLLSVSFCRF
jgi:hypothetical protein